MELRNPVRTPLAALKRILAAMLIAMGALACLGCAGSAPPPLQRFEFSKIVMGSRARIVLFAENPNHARDAARDAFSRMEALEQVLSDYRPTSEVMALRSLPTNCPARISETLAGAIERSLALSRDTEGRFDITIGPVIKLWRTARNTMRLPDPDDLNAARAAVGYDKLRFDPQQRTIIFTAPGMQLDFGGIGKGIACDTALDTIRSHGIRRALVDVGGDLAAGDPPPGRPGWRIAAGPDRAIDLANAAIASSGSTERFIEIDGTRYSHIVDPRTGLGIDPGLLVVVIAPDATTADALASAAAVTGPAGIDELLAAFPGTFGLLYTPDAEPRPFGATAPFLCIDPVLPPDDTAP